MGNTISNEGGSDNGDSTADELYLAAREGRQSDLRAILRRPGANPSGRTSTGRTPLIGAALGDAWEAAQLLLEAGARSDEPDAPENGGCTPLMVAAQRNAQAVAGVLLHAGADADAATKLDGQTALMWCCQADLARMAGLLIARGARIDRRRFRDSATPLMLAAKNNAGQAAGLLLELGAPTDSRGPAGFTALMVCALVDAVDVAGRLLTAGADRLVADAAGRTALHVCARHGSLGVARLLLDSGVDPNPEPTSPQCGGHTPVTLAAAHGRLACLRLLVRQGANYRHRCADGCDILQLAEKSGCAQTMELARALLVESQEQAGASQQPEDDFRWLHTHKDGRLRPELKPALAAILRTVSEDDGKEDNTGQMAKQRDKSSYCSDDASVPSVQPLIVETADDPKDDRAAASKSNGYLRPDSSISDVVQSEDSSDPGSDRSDTPVVDNVIEQLIIKKRVVTKETSGDRVVSVREDLLEIVVDCGEISETVHVKSGAAAIAAAAATRSDGLRSTGSQFYPKVDSLTLK